MIRTTLLSIALLGAVACKKDDVSAHVDCAVKPPNVECTVTQTKGTAEVEVCWDFKVTCASNATLETTHACATVKDSKTTTTTIPEDKIKITGKCEGAMTPALTNMTIAGKAATN